MAEFGQRSCNEIQGTVRLEVEVGQDGRVKEATPTGGPQLLRRAAVEAVEQWVYQPALRNGVPVEAVTSVDVGFVLPDKPAAPQPPGDEQSGNVPSASLIEPKQARIEGTARLNITIGRDGKVKNVEFVSGNPLLAPAAIDAVKHWGYRPASLNGQPAEVGTQVDVDFPFSPPLLGLKVERSEGQLLLRWNRLVQDAQRATLSITDGDHTEDVDLALGTLRGGSTVYAPLTSDVSFRLEIVTGEGKRVSESIRAPAWKPSLY